MIIKSFGYGNGSPYNSSTFNRNNDRIFNANGPLSAESIQNVGPNVVIRNLTFIQEGLIVQSIGLVGVPLPPNLPAPYYLVASSPDNQPIDNIIWGFVKSPQDVSSNAAILAAWDGQEWNMLPLMDIAHSMIYRRVSAIAWNMMGLNLGFQFLPNFTNGTYNIGSGLLTDVYGEMISKNTTHVLTEIPSDPDFTRIDAVLYRRDIDSVYRIGQFELHQGPGYTGDLYENLKVSNISTGATSNYRVINPPDNTSVVLYLEGDVIYLAQYSDDRATQLVAPVALTTGIVISQFDATLTVSGRIFIVFADTTNLGGLFVDPTGAIITPPYQIHTFSTNPLDMSVCTDYQGSLYVMTLAASSPTTSAPYLSRLDSFGVLRAPTAALFVSGTMYAALDMVVDQDLFIQLALEDETNGLIELGTFNNVGGDATPRIVISDLSILEASPDVPLATDAVAKDPRIFYSETGFVYVSFLQETGTGFGVGVYCETYESNIGYKAMVFSDTAGTINYAINIDWSDNAYILYTTATGTYYFNVSLYRANPYMDVPFQISATSSASVDVLFDRRGALITAYEDPVLSTSKLTPDVRYDFDDFYQTLTPQDFFVAYIERPINAYIPWYQAPFSNFGGGTAPGGGSIAGPGIPAISGGGIGGGGGGGGGDGGGGGLVPPSLSAALQKTDSILYSAGVFSYAGTTLTWTAEIQIIDPYRGTYFIPAGTISMPDKQVLFVEIPGMYYLTEDAGSQGADTITVSDTLGLSTGQSVFLGSQTKPGMYATIININGLILTLSSPATGYIVVDGAYMTPVSLTAKTEQQSGPTLRPGTTGYIPPNIYVIAECMGTEVTFRSGSLTLTQGSTGRLGVTTTEGVPRVGAFTSYDKEYEDTTDSTDKLLGQARLREVESDRKRVLVTPILQTMNSTATLGQVADNVPLLFDGCQIDILAGKVYSYNGITDLVMDFTPPVIPAGEYLWGAVTLIVGENDPDRNFNYAGVYVSFGTLSNVVLDDAPRALFEDGIPAGHFWMLGDGVGYEDITFANITQIGAGGGGGGGGGGAWKAFPKATATPNIYSVAAGGTIPLERKRMQYWRVQGEAGSGAANMSLTPFGTNPIWKDTDVVRLIGMDDTDYPVIENSVGTQYGIDCNGIIELKKGRIVELQYDLVRELWSDPTRNF